MQIIDLSQPITSGMPLFCSAAPQPIVSPWMSHAQAAASGRYWDCSCEITEVRFITSLGTYLDSPFHFDPGGSTIDQLRLEQLVLPGVVIDCTRIQARRPVGPEALRDVDLVDKAVLFRTGWSGYWGQPMYYAHPYLAAETALELRDQGAKLVGIDTLVIDDVQNPRRPVHVTLLRSGVLIVENLTNLGALPLTGFTFHAAPVKVAGAAAFPVRAYGVVAD